MFGAITSNKAHDNCVGILFLEAPDSPTDWVAKGHQVNHNNKVCEATQESPPASGVGIALIGGHDITLQGNTFNANAPGGFSAFSGGIVLVANSSANSVIGNGAHGNVPFDLFDVSGAPITFAANSCGHLPPARAVARRRNRGPTWRRLGGSPSGGPPNQLRGQESVGRRRC